MAKKSIVEEALLEAKQLEEALKRNSKEILAATMKQDIDEIVKASLYEGDESAKKEEELDEESQMESFEDESSTMVMDEQEEEGEGEEEMEFSDEEPESEESEEEPEGEESEEEPEGGEEMDMDFSIEEPESEESEDTDVVDMTQASHKELVTVFKKMSDDDEIEVIKTGNNLDIKDNKTGAEYMIKMDESMRHDDEDESMSYDEVLKHMEDDEDESMHYGDEDESSCDECGWQESSQDEGEPIYEITFDDEDDDDDMFSRHGIKDIGDYDLEKTEKPSDDFSDEFTDDDSEDDSEEFDSEDDSDEEDSDESMWKGNDEGVRRTQADRRKVAIHPQNYPSSRMDESIKSEYKQIIKEYKELKDKYSQTKDALKVFRDKLSEIALFNSNLTHAVKLFMEHATTKTEKTNIMKRFDEEASTLKESKRLYKTITNELKDRKPISEKVEKKINESLTKGSSDTLIESKVYVDPQISKIHDLMEKLDNRK